MCAFKRESSPGQSFSRALETARRHHSRRHHWNPYLGLNQIHSSLQEPINGVKSIILADLLLLSRGLLRSSTQKRALSINQRFAFTAIQLRLLQLISELRVFGFHDLRQSPRRSRGTFHPLFPHSIDQHSLPRRVFRCTLHRQGFRICESIWSG